MELSECKVGFAITGSFCTFDKIIPEIKALKDKGIEIFPIYSFNASQLDNRFGRAGDFVKKIEEITGKNGIKTIPEAEPIGPGKLFDIMIIAPCTGNTIAKLANGIVDSPVLMAAKAHLRNNRPLVISISTNDGLGINMQNIGKLMVMKNIYFVPFGQDDPMKKANSLIARLDYIEAALVEALEGRQLQPILV